jgi:predicted ribosomally synthesized peptide with nif11-like leader
MSSEHLDAMLAKYREDEEFAARINAAADADAVVAAAAEYGFDVESADLASAAAEFELRDAELEGVAGGYSCSPNCAAMK